MTRGGDEELEEPLVIRPTSEAIIGTMYAKWIQSWRDLPVLINQWANIVRWEKVTRLFLRTTEFLWQEGHTAHETADEAEDETLTILGLYKEFVETELAMPVIAGPKSDSEKFAGAARTYSIEALMGDGRALQAGTSHNLGQNFARAFGIQFQARDKSLQHIWGTSWGMTTRLIGGVIMTHGDDSGLVFPPRVAPHQVVIVPIPRGNWQETVLPKARAVRDDLTAAGIRVTLDDRDAYTPGWKYAEWEMRGVPLRLEIGPKDIEKGSVVLVRRDTREKRPAPMSGLPGTVSALLDEIQRDAVRARAEVPRGSHQPHGFVRRVQADHGRTSGLRDRPVVRHAASARPRSRPRRRRPSATCRCEGEASGPTCIRCGAPAVDRCVLREGVLTEDDAGGTGRPGYRSSPSSRAAAPRCRRGSSRPPRPPATAIGCVESRRDARSAVPCARSRGTSPPGASATSRRARRARRPPSGHNAITMGSRQLSSPIARERGEELHGHRPVGPLDGLAEDRGARRCCRAPPAPGGRPPARSTMRPA